MPTKQRAIANNSNKKKAQAILVLFVQESSFRGDFVLKTFNQTELVEFLTKFLFLPISINSHINIFDLAKWQVQQRSNYIAYIKF